MPADAKPTIIGAPSRAQADSPRPLKILILEDEAREADLMISQLRKAGLDFTVERVDTRPDFTRALKVFIPDVLLLADCKLPDFNASEALAYVRHDHPEIPVVIVTGVSGAEAIVEFLETGAKDYVLKSNLMRLPSAVDRAISVEQGIRARKAAEASVRASELQYRRLFEAARDGILVLDADTAQIVDVNPFLIDLLGYS